MKIKKSIFFAAVLTSVIALGSSVYAACDTNRCTDTIQRLYISGTTLYVSTAGDERNLNCTSPSNVYVTLSTQDADFDRKYALLLTAASLDKSVGIRINEGSANCSINYIYMDM